MKTIVILLSLFISFTCEAQRVYANEVRINNRFILDGYEVNAITNTLASTNDNFTLATTKAIEDFVLTSTGGGDTTTANGAILANSSTVLALLSNQTFTGAGYDVSGVATINVSCLSGSAGVLYVDMGPDSTNWDRTMKFSTYSDNGKTLFRVNAMVTPLYQYFRIRYVNGASNQGYFRLQTIVHYQKDGTNSKGSKDVLYVDESADLIRPVSNYQSDVTMGLISNKYTVSKFGVNSVIPNSGYEVIWDGSSTYTFPTTAERFRVKAGGNINDTSAGTGARKVAVVYLDSAWIKRIDTLTLAGALISIDSTSIPGYRVYETYVIEVGTYGGANTGDVKIENVTTGQTVSIINADNGKTQMAIYTVPVNYTAYLQKLTITVSRANSANIKFFERKNANNIASSKASKELFASYFDVEGSTSETFSAYRKFDERTDIWVEAIRNVGASNASVSIQFDLILIKN